MKLMAMRLDPTCDKSDLADMLNLRDIVGLQTPEDVLDFAASFYPEAHIRGRLPRALQRNQSVCLTCENTPRSCRW
jgi:hypothetical protein